MSDHRQLEGGIALLRRVIAPGGRASKLAFPVRRLARDGLGRARYWQRPCTHLPDMARVVAVFDSPLKLTSGRIYTAQACGRQRDDGRWEGWLEFVPDDMSVVLRTQRETTQRNLADLEYWASGLTPVYLQGALDRTLTPTPVVVDPPEVPAVYDEPAPRGSVSAPIMSSETELLAETQPVLDPFSVYAYGEEELARQLATLNRHQLLAIVLVYNLASSAVDLDTLTVPELIAWIVGAVRERLAA